MYVSVLQTVFAPILTAANLQIGDLDDASLCTRGSNPAGETPVRVEAKESHELRQRRRRRADEVDGIDVESSASAVDDADDDNEEDDGDEGFDFDDFFFLSPLGELLFPECLSSPELLPWLLVLMLCFPFADIWVLPDSIKSVRSITRGWNR